MSTSATVAGLSAYEVGSSPLFHPLTCVGRLDTAGSSGRPLVLLQAPAISNLPTQVNGWKSSDDPTSYALNPATVYEVDTDYTYADAYITWDGETGATTCSRRRALNAYALPVLIKGS